MTPDSVLDLPGVAVHPDRARGTWQVDALGDRHTVREWTWGERRRLISECTTPDGTAFDRERFVTEFTELVAQPAPAPRQRPLLAAVALRLLGVHPGATPAPLLETEAALAATWRWGPADLDPQPAPRLDEHAARLGSAAGAPPGWNAIVVADG